ncbi:hypothetical protein K0U07_04290 [bacterium]|nr:hypothetical protein [bacterium]
MGARLALEALLYYNAPFLSLTCLSTTLEIEDREKRALQESSWVDSLKSNPLKTFVDDWYNAPLFDTFTPPSKRYSQNPLHLIKVLQDYSTLSSPDFKKIICRKKLPLHFIYREGDKKAAPLKDYQNLYFLNAKSHAIHMEAPSSLANIIRNILVP